MKMGIRKELDWAYVGALLANGDDNEQAEFFKAFVKECLSWGTHLQVEGQLASVNLMLTPAERETLSMIGLQEGAR